MPKKGFNSEQIVTLLRQIEVVMGQGKSTQITCRDAGISEQSFREELLNGEIYYSLKEAQIIIEQWRKHYNTIRSHSALNYRPPAPQKFAPLAHHIDEIIPMQQSLSCWLKKSVRSQQTRSPSAVQGCFSFLAARNSS